MGVVNGRGGGMGRREVQPLMYGRRREPRTCAVSYVYAAMALVLAYLTYLGTGLFCTSVPPPRRSAGDGLCFEVVRRAHYTEVVYTMGSPMQEYRLLLRYGEGEGGGGVHLYSNDARWSTTMECNGTVCEDAVMMSDREHRVRVIGRFHLSKSVYIPNVEYALGLDGTFYVDSSYRLGSHRLCPESHLTCDTLPLEFDRLDVAWQNGHIETSLDSMARGTWREATASRARCSGAIAVFPIELMAPERLLSVSISDVLEKTDFYRLYEAYEIGVGVGSCSMAIDVDPTARLIIADSCHQNAYCRSTASVSYFYVASSELMFVRQNQTGCIGARHDASLGEITYVASYEHTMGLAWIRLFLMMFAAAIVYVRSSDINVKVDTIFVRCIHTISEGRVTHVQSITMERALLALVAAVTRVVIPLIRWRVLAGDGLLRALTTELIAGSASLVHWALLHVDCSARRFNIFVFESVPLFLGGSSAVIDVSCATMLAFTNTPLRGGTSTFDAVVRMLTTVLISLVCISRCFFSISCAGLVIGVHKRWPMGDLILMIVATVFWLLQTISIAVCICDLYATPTAWSFARASHIDVTIVTTAIFSVFSVLSGPTISTTATRISERARMS